MRQRVFYLSGRIACMVVLGLQCGFGTGPLLVGISFLVCLILLILLSMGLASVVWCHLGWLGPVCGLICLHGICWDLCLCSSVLMKY